MAGNDLRRRFFSSAVWRYVLAVAAALVAMECRVLLTPYLGEHNLYHTAWLSVAFSAWYCGLGPSILNVLISAVGLAAWSLSSRWVTTLTDPEQLAAMLGFIFFSAVIIALAETSRRANAKRIRLEEGLRETLRAANDQMQQQINLRTAELQRITTQLLDQAKLIDLANDAIFVRTRDHTISFWNQGAERLYGWSKREALGRLTHDLLHTVFPVPFSEIAESERWEGELIHTKRDGSKISVASRWSALRDDRNSLIGWLEINTDVTPRKRAEESARTLSARILNLQDDERRRIARELHDSLGQYLVSAKVNLDLLQNTIAEPHQIDLLSECSTNIAQCISETRTISHLLHPPLLDEAGFASAARWYIDGFAQRGAFSVELDFPPFIKRMDRVIETVLFRVLQEALTNAHRHSGGSAVRISLDVKEQDRVQLRIADNGDGIPRDRLRSMQNNDSLAGVGLAGMRQRLRELGGDLKIASAHPGTVIEATIPLRSNSKDAMKVEAGQKRESAA